MSRRRELLLGAAIGVTVLAALATMAEVFVTDAWVRPAVVSVGGALLVAVVARAAGVHGVVAWLGSSVAFLVVATAVHVPGGSPLPGVDELRAMRELLETGVVSVRDEAAPVEPLPSLVFVIAAGAWFVTHLAHELAVRLRAPGVALVPVAVLWLVPLAMPQPEPPRTVIVVPFLAAAALVLLLEADTDLVGWARDRVPPRITVAGATIATGAIVLGLVAPWLLPGLGEPAVLDVGTGRDPRGYQPILDVGDRLALPIERPVLRVRSDRRVYLRLAALDTYDDNYWRVGPPDADSFTPDEAELYDTADPLPFETPIGTADTTVVDVEVLDLENIYAPTPYQPVEVTGPGADELVWSQVGGFLATGELSQNELGGQLRTGVVPGFEYRVTAAVPDPALDELRAIEPDRGEIVEHLQLPGDPGRWQPYAALAEQVWAEEGATSTIDRVLTLQRWFTDDGGFRYSVSDIDPLRGSNALETFLFDTRVGYCEYFSTAMAVMLRASGIPARTAVGFLPGELVAAPDPAADDPRGTYQVSTGDAHAWVEVLFPGAGWITFDPTPRSDGTTLAPDASDLSPELPVAERTEQEQASDAPTDAPTDAPSAPDLADTPDLPDAAVAGAAGDGTTPDDGPSPVLVLSVVLGLCLVVVAAVSAAGRRSPQRHRDGAGAALAAQRRVLRVGERLGAGRRRSETAPETLHRWASEGRVEATAAATLAAIAQRAAFAPAGTAVDGVRARQVADELVDQLRSSASRTTRLVAPLRVTARRGRATVTRVAAAGRDRLGV